MMWLKQKTPPKPPPKPPKVDLMTLNGYLAMQQTPTPTTAYLAAHVPMQPLDTWGAPIPLSMSEQYKLDRMVAVLRIDGRARQLLTSGTLDTIEAEAYRDGRPDDYLQLAALVMSEMIISKPPFPAWASGVLGVLFGKDAAVVYGEAQDPQSSSKLGGGASNKPIPGPTPADKSSDPDLKG